ncbi:MAG: tetratricopeptide repeat protein, partial [Pseudomonadota bacterium]|nr:tetratricopeptide repeat protein [Pseudomonadota bacterium]
MRQAFAIHQNGDLATAAAAYETVLRTEPRNFDALHMLGVARLQSGDAADAARLIAQAVALQPRMALAWRNLASARRAAGQVAGAADALQHCVDLGSNDAVTLGALADLNLEAGRHSIARSIFARMIAAQPQDLDARIGLGICEREIGRTAQAAEHFEAVLAANPGHLKAANNLGINFLAQGDNEHALKQFDRVLVTAPTHAPAHNARGLALWNLKRLPEAEAAYGRAIELDAGYAQALTHRAALRTARGHHAGAAADLQRSLQLQPDRADTHHGMGVLLAAQRHTAAAVESFHEALRLRPDFIQAEINLGAAEAVLDHLPQAMQAYDRAVAAHGKCAPREAAMAYANRSALWLRLRRPAEAMTDAIASLTLDPQQPYQAGNAFYLKQMLCDWSDREAAVSRLIDDAARAGSLATPFVMLTVTDDPAAQLAAARAFVANLTADPALPKLPGNTPRTEPMQRLRVAFVSADLHDHATAHLIAGLVENLDKQRFESTAVSYGPLNGDHYQQRLRRAFEHFVDIRTQSDEQAAATMRGMGIDIAIDLKGYTHDGRVGIFSNRAAPVQVSYLGYPGTTGLPQMDYVLADAVTVPPQLALHFSERVVRMPHSYQ